MTRPSPSKPALDRAVTHALAHLVSLDEVPVGASATLEELLLVWTDHLRSRVPMPRPSSTTLPGTRRAASWEVPAAASSAG